MPPFTYFVTCCNVPLLWGTQKAAAEESENQPINRGNHPSSVVVLPPAAYTQSEEILPSRKNVSICPKYQQDFLCSCYQKEEGKGQGRPPSVTSEPCLVTWLGNFPLD